MATTTKTNDNSDSPTADAVNSPQPEPGEKRATASEESAFLAGNPEKGKAYRYQTIGGETVLLVAKAG